MNRNSAPNHAAHDELLVARLQAGDLSGPELERALAIVESCAECAAAYADFETQAGEIVAMRVPARPRDFTLSPKAAGNARRRIRPFAALRFVSGLGFVRSLGASMTAVGLAGILLLGAVSAVTPGKDAFDLTGFINGRNGAGVPAAAPSAEFAESGGTTDQSQQQPLASQVALPGALNQPSAGAPSPAATTITGPQPSAGDGKNLVAGPPAASPSSDTGTADFGRRPNSPSGPEPGALLLAGFGLLAAVGVVVLFGPSLGRRWRSREH